MLVVLVRCCTTITAVVALSLFVAACGSGESNGAFPEDQRLSNATYHEEPGSFRAALLSSAWVSAIEVGGTSTFGREIPRIVRMRIDGAGRLPDRDILLQTPPTVALFGGAGEQRMKHALHGLLTILERRDGFIQGVAMANSKPSFEAAALSGIVEKRAIDGDLTAADQRLISSLLSLYARETSAHSLAWYDTRSGWITIGPEIATVVRQHVVAPDDVTAEESIFAAYVLQHELEHAISPSHDEDYARLQWVEEGTADVLALWPGAAAATAEAMGMPYPERYEQRAYATRRGGYPEWTTSLRLLVRAAGIDDSDPKSLKSAISLLQGPELPDVPAEIASAIVAEQGLAPGRSAGLRRRIAALDGDAEATQRLVRDWL